LGDTSTDGQTGEPIVIVDTLPSGLRPVSIQATADNFEYGTPGFEGPVTCVLSSLTCTFAGKVPPYDEIEVTIDVAVEEGALPEPLNRVDVTGGGARNASIVRSIPAGDRDTPFGIAVNELTPEGEDGLSDTQAGSHPFQITDTLMFSSQIGTTEEGRKTPTPVGLPKDINVELPPGLVGNPTPFVRCTLSQFLDNSRAGANDCSPEAAIGVAAVITFEPHAGPLRFIVPIFNLEPSSGEPARFGFYVPLSKTPVLLDTSVRSGAGEDYGITVTSLNTTQIVALAVSQVTFWGVPGDQRHDRTRGWGCLDATIPNAEQSGLPCQPLGEQHTPSLLTLPTSCDGSALQSSTVFDSWSQPDTSLTASVTAAMPTLDGCNRLSFDPGFSVEPTTDRASAPSGVNVNIDFHDEGLTSGEGLAESHLNKAVVTLPEGFTINPSAGVGLGGCTPADYARETVDSPPGAGCPNDSKLGTVEIETPLLTQKIHGNIFIAQPYENPFGSLVALYLVAMNPETGVSIKLDGNVTPNPVTGQLVTTFDNNPQLPFSHFNFHFREGQQAPLISPAACGTYTTQARLTPWSEPLGALTETSPFTITKGYDGGACPAGGVPPFSPQIVSGTVNNNAGAFSPFYLHLTRTDGEQEISGFSTNMPPGLTGDLTGIPFCPEADIEAARHKTGVQEEASPSCPAASQIGHTLVGTGVGAVLAYVPGKLYLAGPFHGAPFSLVSVTSAVVGPFDLGTVVLRFGLNIDPTTAQVTVTPTGSEPIPTIIDGIVTHVRDIRVYVDRPNFILDPTSCDPLAISSTLSSSLGQSATVSSRFQATNCASLGFKPSFKVSTAGRTSRKNGASLHVRLAYPKAAQGSQANIKYVRVALPRQLPSNLKTIQQACPDHVFEADPAGCSAASRIGTATTTTPILPVPLTGPVYFVSHAAREFPDLVAVLQGYGVTIKLRGRTFIAKDGQTTTTFETVPDAPVGAFEMDLPQGPFSALAAPSGVCNVTKTVLVSKRVKVHGRTVTRRFRKTVAAPLTMPTRMIAQNGAVFTQNTRIKTVGCPKAKAKKASKAGHGRAPGKR
jgi:hypothetical protein